MQHIKCLKGYVRQFLPKQSKNEDKTDKLLDGWTLFWVVFDTYFIPDWIEKENERQKVQEHLENKIENDHKMHAYVLVGEAKNTKCVKTAIHHLLKESKWKNYGNWFSRFNPKPPNIQIVEEKSIIDEVLKSDKCVHLMICSSVETCHCKEQFCLPTDISKLEDNIKKQILLVKGTNTTDEKLITSLDCLMKRLEELEDSDINKKCIKNIPKIIFPEDVGKFYPGILTVVVATLILAKNVFNSGKKNH